jgi:uncharacterized protein (DUF1778 family)
MSNQSTTRKSEGRLSIRANTSQKTILERAAKARHMNVSQFVLDASLREAQEIIDQESRLIVSLEEYDWLVKLMDEAIPTPRLRAALDQKPVWDV